MKPVLILYATREGHTRHIAEHLGSALAARGRGFELADAAHLPDDFSLERYSAAIVAASLHMLKYEREMVEFVKRNLAQLQLMHTVFLSVSLAQHTAEDSSASPEKRAEAEAGVQKTIDAFLSETGWHPARVAAAAGALMYSKYNFLTRFVMKRISRSQGGPVDTSRDYEFTDWTKLDHLVDELIESADR